MAQGEEGSFRFWEFYVLRYSVGAVLGGLILFFLVQQNKSLSSLIFVKPGEPIDLIQVGIFLGVGLVYSYLASAPILVFHAGRFLISRKPGRFFRVPDKLMIMYLGFNLVFPLAFLVGSSMRLELKIWFSLVIFLASSIMVAQFVVIYKCQAQRSRLFLFYKNLAINRSCSKGGIVDSYRHLREHGNAFGIVFFEMVLALFMFAATMYVSFAHPGSTSGVFEMATILAVVVLAWITPAALVWLVGCIIEREFVES
ncbi:hypothetical protein [Pseudomonas chlororaphis]|uniref:hypothetical protein n=1 Tax=Pseudomonas chlororaphis TaxID=587753 RepID=UPI002366D08C|nr:hypothetical protein [Pseudomonas chlororaphis]WDG53697.1 hypothetical protein PUP76_28185 [Pseudomonas chlororaphis]WDH91102.1 hypothetical protein PUP74_14000 [Pseudomonas chlororaphis]